MIPGVTASVRGPSAVAAVLDTKFLIAGFDTWNNEALVLLSPDGVTWQYRCPSPGEFDTLYGAAYCPGLNRWIVVGWGGNTNDGVIYYSDDNGSTWAGGASSFTGITGNTRYFGVCWTGTGFIAVGIRQTTGLPVVVVSADGLSWTEKTSDPATAGQWFRVAGGTGLAVAAGQNAAASAPRVMTSADDGDTWTSRSVTTGFGNIPNDAAVKTAGTKAITVGSGGSNSIKKIQSSPTGVTWTAQDSSPTTGIYWYGSCWSEFLSKFFIVGSDINTGTIPKVNASADGDTWAAKTLTIAEEFFPLAVAAATADGAIVACGVDPHFNDPRMAVSTDGGDNWTQVFPPADLEFEPGNPGPFNMNLNHVAAK